MRRCVVRPVKCPRQPEVDQPHSGVFAVVFIQHIFEFDVPMHHPHPMEIDQRAQDLFDDIFRVVLIKLSRGEVAPLEELGDQP